MTTSEMIIRAKTDFDDVYNAAYKKGKAEGGTDLLQYATFHSGYAFRESVFPDNYEVNFKIKGCSGTIALSYLFLQSNIYKAVIEFETQPSKVATNSIFQLCTNLKYVKFANSVIVTSNAASMFSSCSALETIEGVLDLSECTNVNLMFGYCSLLKDVRFAEGSIKKSLSFSASSNLSDESIESIINGLSDLTGQTSQDLSVHGDVFNRMTAEQKVSVQNKNWTLSAVT